MMSFHAHCSFLAAALVACGTLAAQNPVETIDAQILKTVEEKLSADAPQEVAWGGYLAQRYRLQGASRPLRAALDRWKDREGLKARMTRLHLLDGLLGIAARVPSEQVEYLLDDKMTRAAAFAVMARDPRANLEGLERLALASAEGDDLARTAAARLLIARGLRSQKLGWRIVKTIECHYYVAVTDGAEIDTLEPWADGRKVKYVLTKTQPGFPPLVRIDLSTSQDSEQMMKMIVPGRVGNSPIYLTRKEKAVYRPIDMEFGRKVEHPALHERWNLFEKMAGVPADRFLSRDFAWKDAKTYIDAYTKDRDGLRRRLDKAVVAMRKKGWLGKDDEPEFRIPLKESVQDLREDKSTELPEIPPPPALGK